MRRTGEALVRILEQVTEINGLAGGISTATEQQAVALQEVNTAVQPPGPGDPSRTRPWSKQSTAATHALSRETDELAGLVSRFRDAGRERGLEEAKPAAQATRCLDGDLITQGVPGTTLSGVERQ